MLNLTRRAGQDEFVYILDKNQKPIARFTVCESRGNQVNIGLEAPKDINFVRGELIDPTTKREYDTYLKG